MCTDACPCYIGNRNSNKKIWESEANQNKILRHGRVAQHKVGEGLLPFKWSASDKYKKYLDCPNAYSLTDSTLSFLVKLERSYHCAGICKLPLFYLSKDISAGPPD